MAAVFKMAASEIDKISTLSDLNEIWFLGTKCNPDRYGGHGRGLVCFACEHNHYLLLYPRTRRFGDILFLPSFLLLLSLRPRSVGRLIVFAPFLIIMIVLLVLLLLELVCPGVFSETKRRSSMKLCTKIRHHLKFMSQLLKFRFWRPFWNGGHFES